MKTNQNISNNKLKTVVGIEEGLLPSMKDVFLVESLEVLSEGEMSAYLKGILGAVISLPIAVKIINWMGSLHSSDEASLATLTAVIGIPSLVSLFILIKKILKRCDDREIQSLKDRQSFDRILASKIRPVEKQQAEEILEPITQGE